MKQYLTDLLDFDSSLPKDWEPDANIDYWRSCMHVLLAAAGRGLCAHYKPDAEVGVLNGKYNDLLHTVPKAWSNEDRCRRCQLELLHLRLVTYYNHYKVHRLHVVYDEAAKDPAFMKTYTRSLLESVVRAAPAIRSCNGATCVLPLEVMYANGGGDASHFAAAVFHSDGTIYLVDPAGFQSSQGQNPMYDAFGTCLEHINAILGRTFALAAEEVCFPEGRYQHTLQERIGEALPDNDKRKGCCGPLTLLLLVTMARFNSFDQPAQTLRHVMGALHLAEVASRAKAQRAVNAAIALHEQIFAEHSVEVLREMLAL